MDLEGEETLEGTPGLVVVVQFGGELAVDLVDEVIARRDDGVFIPLGDVDGDGVAITGEPLFCLRIDDDGLSVFRDDAAAAIVVDHRVVLSGGVDVALVAADGPLPVFGQFLRAILNAAVVLALDFHLHAELEVLQGAPAPDEELIVGEVFGGLGRPDDGSVGNRPEIGIAVPAGEVFAVEEIDEALLRVRGEKGEERG